VLDSEGRIVQKHEGLRDPILYETEIRSLLGLSIGNVKVETFEDTGQIFLKNAERASQLPGVDLTKLSPEQKTIALHKFNAETCTCGCTFTLAQCRIYDRNCQTSKAATSKIITALLHPPRQNPHPPLLLLLLNQRLRRRRKNHTGKTAGAGPRRLLPDTLFAVDAHTCKNYFCFCFCTFVHGTALSAYRAHLGNSLWP